MKLTDVFFAGLYFLLSSLITSLFISVSPLYVGKQQMILSCSIAGAKWGIQIFAALFFLKDKKWLFVRKIGFTCFTGSAILLPYCFYSAGGSFDNNIFFIISLITAVITMIPLYYFIVKKCGVDLRWWLGWLLCLATAISLQLTVVFHVI